MLNPINHYSLESHPTIFDEESLTVLELCARLAGKVNEIIEYVKKTEGKVDDTYRYLVAELETTVARIVEEAKDSGQLDATIMEAMGRFNTLLSGRPWKFNTEADMRHCEDLNRGDLVVTSGYHSANDNGGATYIIREQKETDTNDGATILVNGALTAELVPNGKVNIKQFGAVGDGVTDDTDAIVRAGNYAAMHKLTLESDGAKYHTTERCVIHGVDNINLLGWFPFLEITNNPNEALRHTVQVDRVDHLILRDYKRSTFTIGWCDRVDVIADSTKNPNSAFAYNEFHGGSMGDFIISGIGEGWVNENTFYGCVMHKISIDGDYHHNNNRFYDITVEGGEIQLGNAHSNLFVVRGEDNYTLTTTNKSYDNVVKRTWSPGGANMTFAYDKPDGTVPGAVQTHEMYDHLTHYNLLAVDMWSLPFNNGIDATTGKASVGTWVKYTEGLIIPVEEMMVLTCNIPKHRITVTLYDANMNQVGNDGSMLFPAGPVQSDGTYYTTVNRDYTYIAVHPKAGGSVKYIKLVAQNGNNAQTITGGSVDCWSTSRPRVTNLSCNMAYSNSRPTQTENVPVGFTVRNSVSGSAVWAWRFDGTAWRTVNYENV